MKVTLPVLTTPAGLVTVAVRVGDAPAAAVTLLAAITVVAAPMVSVLVTGSEAA